MRRRPAHACARLTPGTGALIRLSVGIGGSRARAGRAFALNVGVGSLDRITSFR